MPAMADNPFDAGDVASVEISERAHHRTADQHEARMSRIEATVARGFLTLQRQIAEILRRPLVPEVAPPVETETEPAAETTETEAVTEPAEATPQSDAVVEEQQVRRPRHRMI
jgi:hypothetical protein